jgi:hypothetical protein
MGEHKKMAKLIRVQWDADALAKALSTTESEAQAWVLARALVIKLIEDTKADEIQARYLNENKAEEQAQVKTLTEALMRRWMRPRRIRQRRRALSIRSIR